MCHKFGVYSSRRFLERGHTRTHIHTVTDTPLITIPTHRLYRRRGVVMPKFHGTNFTSRRSSRGTVVVECPLKELTI